MEYDKRFMNDLFTPFLYKLQNIQHDKCVKTINISSICIAANFQRTSKMKRIVLLLDRRNEIAENTEFGT
jgi:hypothetical protein